MRRSMVYAAVVGASALALSGCGDDNGSDDGGGGGSAYGGGGGGTTATTEAPAATATVAVTRPATIDTAGGSLGTHLVDGKGRTLYLWRADTGKKSTCSGSCAVAWPPLLTKGDAKASGKARSGLLGTTKRSGGATQVTYAGHPLYRFAGDAAAGDANGQGNDGFGALWYVVAPSGKAITTQ